VREAALLVEYYPTVVCLRVESPSGFACRQVESRPLRTTLLPQCHSQPQAVEIPSFWKNITSKEYIYGYCRVRIDALWAAIPGLVNRPDQESPPTGRRVQKAGQGTQTLSKLNLILWHFRLPAFAGGAFGSNVGVGALLVAGRVMAAVHEFH
jgi:hypothetical protein